MTFGLKRLEDLNKDFDDTLKILLANENKTKIADTSEDRRYLLQFLESTRTYLNSEAANPLPQELKPYGFYGAQYLIITFLNRSRWIASTMAKTLQGMITPTQESEQPDVRQMADFYKAINIFLKLVFNGLDSRQGINPDHPLKLVPIKQLQELMNLAYELERDSQKELFKTIAKKSQMTQVNNGETGTEQAEKTAPKANPDEYVINKSIPESAIAVFGSWDKLQSTMYDIVLQERGNKNCATMEEFSAKYPVRAKQLHFLLHIRESLLEAKMNDKEKAAILAGAMHLVYQQTAEENTLSSFIYDKFGETLHLKAASSEDKEALMCAASRYVRYMTISNKKEFRKEHIFSTIKDFDLISVLNLFQDIICAQRKAALNTAVDFATLKPQAEKSSWLPGIRLFGTSKKETVEETPSIQNGPPQ